MSGILIVTIILAIASIYFGIRCYRLRRNCQNLQKENLLIQQKLHEVLEEESKLQEALDQQKSQYEARALEDSLTGLPSRAVLNDRIEQAIAQGERYHTNFALMLLEIGELDRVNAVLGYHGGDLLLQEVSKRLQKSVRHVDTVCRYSGSGFAFLLPQIAKAESAAYVAQRLVDCMEQAFHVIDVELFLTASIGISVFSADADNQALLIKNAESALQQAKSRGSCCFQFYKQEMYVQGRRELLLSSRLRSPDIFTELAIYYQPQVHLEKKTVSCMEALLRWHHPDYGLIGPLEFLTLAENNGSLVIIGEWILRHACEQLQLWKEQGLRVDCMAINVALRQLENPQFVHRVSQILHETRVKPQELIFEISESLLTARIDLVEKTLHMLKYLGVKIAVDDFGVGNVSLQHLRQFPLDFLKIDASLVRDIATKPETLAIVKMILALANNLALTVVAEGVETEEQKKLLLDLGCGLMQGHLFSHPLMPQEFTARFVENIIHLA